MTAKAALRKRARLREEADRAKAAARQHHERSAALDRELAALDGRRKHALREQARTGSVVALDDLDAEHRRLSLQRAREREAAKAARAAHRQAETEFDELHRDAFDALAEAAEELTQDAMAKLAALEHGYRDAYRAWAAARSEWNALAVRNDLRPVAHPPMPDPRELFTAAPPRPPQVQPVDATPAAPEADGPPAGSTRTWEHLDGRRMAATVGDHLDRQLLKHPEWVAVYQDCDTPEAA